MFPEGARSLNGQLGPAFSGAALIAIRSRAPVLPIGVSGTEKIKGLAWLLRRHKVTVNIGPSFYLEQDGTRITNQELTEATDIIMKKIAGLLPAGHRGNYTVE
jgi:1-acyl-sn-glycerol-3-phosphate acyltransferase